MRRRKGIPAEKKVNITIGEFIAAVRQESMIYPRHRKLRPSSPQDCR